MEILKSQNLPNNLVLAFVIGVLSYHTLMIPSAVAIIKDPSKRDEFDYERKSLYMPYVCGIVNILLFLFILKVLPERMNSWYTLGALAIVIHMTMDKITGMESHYGIKNIYLYYLMMVAFYALLYGIVFQTMSNTLC